MLIKTYFLPTKKYLVFSYLRLHFLPPPDPRFFPTPLNSCISLCAKTSLTPSTLTFKQPMVNQHPSNKATLSSPFNSLEKVNAPRRLPSFPTKPIMEDLANEVRRIVRNLNLGSKIELLLEEIPLNYHPTQNIGKKKYKGEVVLAHSRYHQENPSVPCTVYQHFVPLNIDAIL